MKCIFLHITVKIIAFQCCITGLLYQDSYCVMSVVNMYGVLAVIPYFDPVIDP